MALINKAIRGGVFLHEFAISVKIISMPVRLGKETKQAIHRFFGSAGSVEVLACTSKRSDLTAKVRQGNARLIPQAVADMRSGLRTDFIKLSKPDGELDTIFTHNLARDITNETVGEFRDSMQELFNSLFIPFFEFIDNLSKYVSPVKYLKGFFNEVFSRDGLPAYVADTMTALKKISFDACRKYCVGVPEKLALTDQMFYQAAAKGKKV